MTYYIFGGNGFVGRYLAAQLIRNGQCVAVCDLQSQQHEMIPESCAYYCVDIRNVVALEHIPIAPDDVIINLAANQYHTTVPRDAEHYFFSVNTQGTANILQVAYAKGARAAIQFTTDMIYGKPQYLPVDIQHAKCPFGPYGASKKAAEEICVAFRGKGMRITIMRPRMINGPGRLGILVNLFKLIDLNLPVPTIGTGKNHYQMVSVFDCVSAVIAAINKGIPDKEYNLGSLGSPDIRHLLKGVIRDAGSHSVVVPTPGRLVKFTLGVFAKIGLPIMHKEQFMIADEEYVLDIAETMADLDWKPLYNDEDMLKDAYRMYKESLNHRKINPSIGNDQQ